MAWEVSEISENVHQITFNANYRSTEWEQWVFVSGDRHHDNKHSDHKLQRKHLEQAKERNAPIIDVGDFFCLMQGKYDKRKSAGGLRPEHSGEDYFDAVPDTAVDFFKPYAQQFAVIGYGNHETAIIKHHQTDILARFVYRLNKEAGSNVQVGGYGGYVKLVFREPKAQRTSASKLVKYFHGAGGGAEMSFGTLNVKRRASVMPDADIVVSGHIHNKFVVEMARERITSQGRIYLDKQLHVQVGSYKEEYGTGSKGWHVERGAPPKPLGGFWLRFSSSVEDGNRWAINVQAMDA